LGKKISLYQTHLKKLSTSPIAFKHIDDKQHITTAKSKEPHKPHQQNSQTKEKKWTTQHIPHTVHHHNCAPTQVAIHNPFIE
jgi:hypothetical protein